MKDTLDASMQIHYVQMYVPENNPHLFLNIQNLYHFGFHVLTVDPVSM